MKSKIVGVFFALLLVSCKVNKNVKNDLNYMQNIEKVAIESSAKNSGSTIQHGDQLVILITAKDMDVVKPFNQNYSSSEVIQTNNIAGGNTPNQGVISISGPTYIVDTNGDIDFPLLGKINTTDKDLTSLKEEIRDRMTQFVVNPTVNIRLANFKVTVLGEVNRQGDYTISNGRATILNALGMAGDLTMYGKREDVLVIRTENGQITHGKINLHDANLINSPYYNLKQGDAIIVSSNNTKDITAKQNPNTGLILTGISIAVTAVAVVVSLFNKK
ncbi:polysaccharide export protein [Chryseobacterium carnipullorum]|uniref:Polysaccharide export protein n=1 Tax=Chryseobacterium carnipullorum TaxID=1124835 RepID=A0A376DPJ1_CHRCU|nr:polysaccharide biosynthesis/export family protein [Chryseobacterium carnipullorum]AZA48826.1 polysaccharide export protein [Chryseobacterium carnipullorum]AZA63734.1 polysaccharide export protein [Chryseobacterium carnipullorum]STC93297.1 polysaccharide export protein Wza [Chryseobacterium carnipullorum]